MRRGVLVAALGLVASFVVFRGADAPTASAQAAPTLSSATVTNRFPDGLRFAVEAQSSAEITEVELRYQIQPDGVPTRVVARCTPERGARVSCSAEVASRNPPIPPFAELRYRWGIVDAAGGTTEGPEQTVFYEDTRFQWRQVTSGNLTAYTYGSTDGRTFTAAGRASLDKTGRLLQTTVNFPVRVVVYNSPNDMSVAMQRRSDTFHGSILTLGQRVSTDAVLVLNDRGATDTLQHELAHVVTKLAGEGGIGSMPSWLDEGTAVNAQANVGSGYEGAVRAAIASNQLLSWRSMTSPTGNPELVNLFYGESYYAVRFLIDRYGEAKFAQLFAVFKRGATVDDALREAYGKDLIGLENEWRASLNLPARTGGEARNEAQTQGTFTPFGSTSGSEATPAGAGPGGSGDEALEEEDDGGSGAILLIAGAAVAAAVIVVGGTIVLARRR